LRFSSSKNFICPPSEERVSFLGTYCTTILALALDAVYGIPAMLDNLSFKLLAASYLSESTDTREEGGIDALGFYAVNLDQKALR